MAVSPVDKQINKLINNASVRLYFRTYTAVQRAEVYGFVILINLLLIFCVAISVRL